MRELVFYAIGAAASLFILGYAVHMLIGGLVSSRTESIVIAAVVLLGAVAVAWMAWDVIRKRSQM